MLGVFEDVFDIVVRSLDNIVPGVGFLIVEQTFRWVRVLVEGVLGALDLTSHWRCSSHTACAGGYMRCPCRSHSAPQSGSGSNHEEMWLIIIEKTTKRTKWCH